MDLRMVRGGVARLAAFAVRVSQSAGRPKVSQRFGVCGGVVHGFGVDSSCPSSRSPGHPQGLRCADFKNVLPLIQLPVLSEARLRKVHVDHRPEPRPTTLRRPIGSAPVDDSSSAHSCSLLRTNRRDSPARSPRLRTRAVFVDRRHPLHRGHSSVRADDHDGLSPATRTSKFRDTTLV